VDDDELARHRAAAIDFELGVARRVVGEIDAFLRRISQKSVVAP
jgi:hypothetical protein